MLTAVKTTVRFTRKASACDGLGADNGKAAHWVSNSVMIKPYQPDDSSSSASAKGSAPSSSLHATTVSEFSGQVQVSDMSEGEQPAPFWGVEEGRTQIIDVQGRLRKKASTSGKMS